jgi:hypothetical protein
MNTGGCSKNSVILSEGERETFFYLSGYAEPESKDLASITV